METPSGKLQRPPTQERRPTGTREVSVKGRAELPKESRIPQSVGNVHIRLLRQLDQLDKKVAFVAPSLLQDLSIARQLVEESNKLYTHQLTRMNLELQKAQNPHERSNRIYRLLHSISEVLRLIANDSTDERFQQLYDEFMLLLQKVEKTRSGSPVGEVLAERSLSANRQLIQELKEQQSKRVKAEYDIDSIFEGTRQSLLMKEARIKELEKLLVLNRTEVLAANSTNEQHSKINKEQSVKIQQLEQLLKQTSEVSIVHVEPTSATLAESRLGRLAKSPTMISSPRGSEIGTDTMLSPSNRNKSRLPPLPLSPSSNADDKKRSQMDWHQESLMRMLFIQACAIEASVGQSSQSSR